MLTGGRYLLKSKELIALYSMQFLFLVTLYTTNVLLPLFVQRAMRMGAREFGLIDAAWAAGAVIGGLVILRNRRKADSTVWMGGSMLALSISVAVFATSRSLLAAEFGYICMGLAFAAGKIAIDSRIQLKTPVDLQGRTRSFASLAIAIASLFIYLAVGYIGDIANIRGIYAVIAILLAFSAFTVLYIHMRGFAAESRRPMNTISNDHG